MKRSPNKSDLVHKPDWHWNGRSLTNYKDIHAGTAKNKGVEREFQSAKTLTQARKILFGFKRGQTK